VHRVQEYPTLAEAKAAEKRLKDRYRGRTAVNDPDCLRPGPPVQNAPILRQGHRGHAQPPHPGGPGLPRRAQRDVGVPLSPKRIWSHGCDPGPIDETTPQSEILAWAMLGLPDAMDEWFRRRRAAEAAGIDPDSLDDEAIGDDSPPSW
jgi:hypothetical protein